MRGKRNEHTAEFISETAMPKEGYPLKKQLFITCTVTTDLHVLDPTCRLTYLHVNECIKFMSTCKLHLLLPCRLKTIKILIEDDIHIFLCHFFFLQSSAREISEHLHCSRTPGMLSHTEDFNLDTRGKCVYSACILSQLQRSMSKRPVRGSQRIQR